MSSLSIAADNSIKLVRFARVAAAKLAISSERSTLKLTKGPPTIFGFAEAATCACGTSAYESMIGKCRWVKLRAAVAGAMRCDHAYQRSIKGSTATLVLR